MPVKNLNFSKEEGKVIMNKTNILLIILIISVICVGIAVCMNMNKEKTVVINKTMNNTTNKTINNTVEQVNKDNHNKNNNTQQSNQKDNNEKNNPNPKSFDAAEFNRNYYVNDKGQVVEKENPPTPTPEPTY